MVSAYMSIWGAGSNMCVDYQAGIPSHDLDIHVLTKSLKFIRDFVNLLI
jgi:hypothetical protein